MEIPPPVFLHQKLIFACVIKGVSDPLYPPLVQLLLPLMFVKTLKHFHRTCFCVVGNQEQLVVFSDKARCPLKALLRDGTTWQGNACVCFRVCSVASGGVQRGIQGWIQGEPLRGSPRPHPGFTPGSGLGVENSMFQLPASHGMATTGVCLVCTVFTCEERAVTFDAHAHTKIYPNFGVSMSSLNNGKLTHCAHFLLCFLDRIRRGSTQVIAVLLPFLQRILVRFS